MALLGPNHVVQSLNHWIWPSQSQDRPYFVNANLFSSLQNTVVVGLYYRSRLILTLIWNRMALLGPNHVVQSSNDRLIVE